MDIKSRMAELGMKQVDMIMELRKRGMREREYLLREHTLQSIRYAVLFLTAITSAG